MVTSHFFTLRGSTLILDILRLQISISHIFTEYMF